MATNTVVITYSGTLGTNETVTGFTVDAVAHTTLTAANARATHRLLLKAFKRIATGTTGSSLISGSTCGTPLALTSPVTVAITTDTSDEVTALTVSGVSFKTFAWGPAPNPTPSDIRRVQRLLRGATTRISADKGSTYSGGA